MWTLSESCQACERAIIWWLVHRASTIVTPRYGRRMTKPDMWEANENKSNITRSLLLSLRLGTLAIMVALLTLHLRSVRVFRWEQSVSGGLLITYLVAVVGLALCAGNPVLLNKGVVLQTYLCGTGAALLALNAACLWRRWHFAGDLTRAVADLLSALGVPLRQQVLIKVILSSIAACSFLIDMAMIILVLRAAPNST